MRIYILLAIFLSIVFFGCQSNSSSNKIKTTQVVPDSVKIDSLTQLINKNPRIALHYSQRAELLLEKGDLAKAMIDLIKANKLDSLNPTYYCQLADYYLQLGKSEMVNTILLKGNSLVPNNKEILYRLGNLYFYIQDYRKAMDFLNKANEVDSYFAPVYFTKGLIFKETGDTIKAITSFQFAIEREPEYYDAYMQLGLLFAAKADSLAIDYYNNALQIIPASYEALYAKAMFYQQNNRIEKAVSVYYEMIEQISGGLPFVHYNLGFIEMVYFGNFEDAIARFDSALFYRPNYPDALCNRAFCYENTGNTKAARADYEKALQIIPSFNIAIKGLERLDKK